MKPLRILVRTTWISLGMVAIAAWSLLAVGTGLTFLFAYGNAPGAYTGQMDDKQAAWSFLIMLAVRSVIVLTVVVWPLTRWRHQRQG